MRLWAKGDYLSPGRESFVLLLEDTDNKPAIFVGPEDFSDAEISRLKELEPADRMLDGRVLLDHDPAVLSDRSPVYAEKPRSHFSWLSSSRNAGPHRWNPVYQFVKWDNVAKLSRLLAQFLGFLGVEVVGAGIVFGKFSL